MKDPLDNPNLSARGREDMKRKRKAKMPNEAAIKRATRTGGTSSTKGYPGKAATKRKPKLNGKNGAAPTNRGK